MLAARMARLIWGCANLGELAVDEALELGGDGVLMLLPHWQHLFEARLRRGVDADRLRPL